MPRKLFREMIVVACVAMSAQSAAAQSGFTPGYTDIGPTIGIGGINGASLSFGARFEHGLTKLESMGNGTLGIMVGAEYYSWSTNYGIFGNYSLKYIPIGGTVNYHFNLDNKSFDPFIGLGLGYEIVSYSCPYTGGCGNAYSSSIYIIGRLGARYFFSDNMAAYGDVGAGAGTLHLGLMFKLGGG